MARRARISHAARTIAVAIAPLGLVYLQAAPGAQAQAQDLRGAAVTAEAQDVLTSEVQEALDVRDGGGQRFQIPAVGPDVPLDSVMEVDGSIIPAGFTAAYWVRNRGVAPGAAEQGTLFVVMHSLRKGGLAPGDYAFDEQAGRAFVAPGDVVEAGDARYKITEVRSIPKPDLPHDEEVWTEAPGRLVVITCSQRADGRPSTHNLVIEAVRA